MEMRIMERCGIVVSQIALGCEGFHEPNVNLSDLLDVAQAHGVNLIDLYSPDPAMRKALGEALYGRRDHFVIQGHLGSIWKDGQYQRTRDLQEVKEGFAQMCHLLQTDVIDIGMIHYVDAPKDWQTVIDHGILDYAQTLKEMGKIKAIGLSSHNPLVSLTAVESGVIDVLMFSVNPCYDLMPASENVDDLFEEKNYNQADLRMDEDRKRLYETCEKNGVAITVMKAFAGGDLLDAAMAPTKVALSVHQCLHYALSRPAVVSVMAGVHTMEEWRQCLAYEQASEQKKDYAMALSMMPKVNWEGHCMYCGHCAPCPKAIDIASVNKMLNLAKAQGQIPETVREHYVLLEHHAGECIACGICETRCPFHVDIREHMRQAAALFKQ